MPRRKKSKTARTLFDMAPVSIFDHIKAKQTEEGFEESGPASEASQHPPGTWEKIEEMRARAERGEVLYHDEDAAYCGRTTREREIHTRRGRRGPFGYDG